MGIGLSLICDGIFYDFGNKKRRSAGNRIKGIREYKAF